jgi:SAM-dependent methyltransferase
MTTEDYGLTTYDEIALGWERRRRFVEDVSAPVRAWLLRELSARAGDVVLELAAGVGDTGFEAAGVLGPGGRLISTDVSPAMVDVGRRRAAELGLSDIEHLVVDAERIPLDTNSVDGVVCRFGYMLMAHPAAALAETRRVLRPGGRLALAVWGAPERNPFFALLGPVLVERGHLPPPEPGAPGVFALASADRLRALLGRAGFRTVSMEEVPVRFVLSGADEYLAIAADTAGPIAILLRALSDDERGALTAELEEALSPFAAGSGYELPGVALAAVAG